MYISLLLRSLESSRLKTTSEPKETKPWTHGVAAGGVQASPETPLVLGRLGDRIMA